MADQTLNVPSLVFVLLLTTLAIRYFFFSPRNPTTASRGRQIDPALVDQIATMFPQVNRRSIQWDLQGNGGSVAATTERILTRGSLDTVSSEAARAILFFKELLQTPEKTVFNSIQKTEQLTFRQPPPSFQPQLPPFSTPSPAAAAAPSRPPQPDLITRYNLKSKLSAAEHSPDATEQGTARNTGSWSESKNERAELLRRRREEKILNARRNMEKKEQQLSQ